MKYKIFYIASFIIVVTSAILIGNGTPPAFETDYFKSLAKGHK